MRVFEYCEKPSTLRQNINAICKKESYPTHVQHVMEAQIVSVQDANCLGTNSALGAFLNAGYLASWFCVYLYSKDSQSESTLVNSFILNNFIFAIICILSEKHFVS